MDNSTLMLAELLIAKLGNEKIKGLLTEDFFVEKNYNKGGTKLQAYVRELKGDSDLFLVWSGEGGQEHRTNLEQLLGALDDAKNEMSCSNWHGDKFDRISEMIIRYCESLKEGKTDE